ncbi:hydroxymethylbilane synthase [Pseudoxanthomonas sp. PXM02]|uniref:hydroxymethylbilane synthase n=1 Tax=Pseudoxanthomonas sp. PXM02 TaxID=2769294 RepID=UPI00177E6A49|nr:hydroxymethylbilane synthase [Pseudoxanthomonas sp. PXM02]MBD9479126.1 hydroxymethylbilane synthase [Pseudoxanthomonas sp. PXM02]
MTTLRIATRKSPLALWQSEHVADRLRAAHPGLVVELVPMSTRGDEVLDRSLAAIGGKGLFLKELELAMLRGEADCAVHSLKDVPMELEGPFALPAILTRADPADAFVSNRFADVAALPQGARVGTSSLRRQAQLRALRPDLELLDLRGNVNTRLAKLDAGEYDAIVLACAGLQRLGFESRIRSRLDAPDWLPAPAQGAVAVECRAEDQATHALFVVLDDAATRVCVEAERAMNRALHGSCHVPVAAFAQRAGDDLVLSGLVGSAADGQVLRAEARGPGADPEALGRRVAAQLLEQGAGAFLA